MLRLLLALPLALVISYSLVAVMAWMVDLNKKPPQASSEGVQFDMFMTEKEQTTERLSRKLPEPPKMKPVAPKVKPSQPTMQQPMSTPTFESLPDINMDLAITGMNISVPSSSLSNIQQSPTTMATPSADIGQSQQVMPLHRIEPVYPRKALQRKIQGFVTLSFDIDKRGQPKNITVSESKPPRVFTREAIKALKNWKYQPQIVNGQAQERTGQKVKLEFTLN